MTVVKIGDSQLPIGYNPKAFLLMLSSIRSIFDSIKNFGDAR